MSNEELLKAAEFVLHEAVEEAEFTRLDKDVAYCNIVATKVEALKAKIEGRNPFSFKLSLVNGRMCVESYYDYVLSSLPEKVD